MKRQRALIFYLILILAEFSAVQSPLHSQELDLQEFYKKALPAVVEIFCYDKDGEQSGGGTGFFIGPGKILTAFHVVEDAYSLDLDSDSIPEEKLGQNLKITILKHDAEADLALLKVDPVNSVSLSIENNIFNLIKPGQRVVTIGNPGQFSFQLSNGIVCGTNDTPAEILCTLAVGPGFSGGPVLREDGKVIGLNRQRFYNLSISVHWRAIQDFLKLRDHPRELPPAGSIAPRSKNIFKLVWRKSTRFIASLVGPVFKWLWKASGRFVQAVGVIILVGLMLAVLLLLARLTLKAARRPRTPVILFLALLAWIIILKLLPGLKSPILVIDTLFWLFYVIPSVALIVFSFVVLRSLFIRRRLKAAAVKVDIAAHPAVKRGARRSKTKRSIPPSARKAG